MEKVKVRADGFNAITWDIDKIEPVNTENIKHLFMVYMDFFKARGLYALAILYKLSIKNDKGMGILYHTFLGILCKLHPGTPQEYLGHVIVNLKSAKLIRAIQTLRKTDSLKADFAQLPNDKIGKWAVREMLRETNNHPSLLELFDYLENLDLKQDTDHYDRVN